MRILRSALLSATLSLVLLLGSITPSFAAAGNWLLYGPGWEAIFKGTIDLENDNWQIVLLTSSYTPAQTTHATWADLSAAEVSGTGYTAGGVSATLTVSRSGLVVTVDTANVSWTEATITAKYAAIVRRAGGSLASTDLTLAYVNLDTGGGSLSSTNGTFAVNINASGIFTATAAGS
jgi:hypothetical protein